LQCKPKRLYCLGANPKLQQVRKKINNTKDNLKNALICFRENNNFNLNFNIRNICVMSKIQLKKDLVNKITLLQSWARLMTAKNRIFGLKNPQIKFGLIRKDLTPYVFPFEDDFIAKRNSNLLLEKNNKIKLFDSNLNNNNPYENDNKKGFIYNNTNNINMKTSVYHEVNHTNTNTGTTSDKNKGLVANNYYSKKTENMKMIYKYNESEKADLNKPLFKCLKLDYDQIKEKEKFGINKNNTQSINNNDFNNRKRNVPNKIFMSASEETNKPIIVQQKLFLKDVHFFRKTLINIDNWRKIVKIQSNFRRILFMLKHNIRKKNKMRLILRLILKDRKKNGPLKFYFRTWLKKSIAKKVINQYILI